MTNSQQKIDDKDVAGFYLKLMGIQAEHFRQTRDLEFKVNLALWAGIVASGGFLHGNVHLDSTIKWVAFAFIALLVFIGHLGLWMVPIQNSEDTDDHFIRDYGRNVEGLLGYQLTPSRQKWPSWVWQTNQRLRKDGWSWILFESGITGLLLVCVGVVLATW